ncbi:hypothetical protein [Erythrobacter sp. QSSC1-22B]|uniref:hypothetical protein n=1 Tax=Erythrobacter sp. QSSC1-22B TaxID=1860125 RepID=UPI00143C7413|nr:hypothetical protein [Erythrobacter sp. QSSC1-22B]
MVFIDGVSTQGGRDRPVTCYGAFHVQMVDGDPVFTKHHICTTSAMDRINVISRLGDLCDGRHVVLGSPEAYETFWDRRHVLQAGLSLIDAFSGLDSVQPSDLSLVGTPESAIIELASTFGLRDSYHTDLMGQARCADVRAQLIWLAYVISKAWPTEATRLFAAFRAWEILERARPIWF